MDSGIDLTVLYDAMNRLMSLGIIVLVAVTLLMLGFHLFGARHRHL